jgi:putative ABC transport system substrate-binding protein
MPVIGFLSGLSPADDAHFLPAFRQCARETGYVEGQDVAIEYRWAPAKAPPSPPPGRAAADIGAHRAEHDRRRGS